MSAVSNFKVKNEKEMTSFQTEVCSTLLPSQQLLLSLKYQLRDGKGDTGDTGDTGGDTNLVNAHRLPPAVDRRCGNSSQLENVE